MGRERLELIAALLRRGGIPAGEAWPGAGRPEPEEPLAAVGLGEMDCVEGVARYAVDILSPRHLGGWRCQLTGAEAAKLLQEAGFSCRMGEMDYLEASDCFRVTVTARLPMESGDAGWEVCCGGVRQEGVISFRAVRDQGRRILGAMAQGEPVGITAGAGGWAIELIQKPSREPEEIAEPFEVTVRRGSTVERFGGCCWNETEAAHGEGGFRLTRRGFALTREVAKDGG